VLDGKIKTSGRPDRFQQIPSTIVPVKRVFDIKIAHLTKYQKGGIMAKIKAENKLGSSITIIKRKEINHHNNFLTIHNKL